MMANSVICHMHGLGVIAIRGDIVHRPEYALHGLIRADAAVAIVPPGCHVEIVIDLRMHGVQNVKSIRIGDIGVTRDSGRIEIPGIRHGKSIYTTCGIY